MTMTMTTPEFRTKLEELLQQEKHGACTRYLCNKVFLETRNGTWFGPVPTKCSGHTAHSGPCANKEKSFVTSRGTGGSHKILQTQHDI